MTTHEAAAILVLLGVDASHVEAARILRAVREIKSERHESARKAAAAE